MITSTSSQNNHIIANTLGKVAFGSGLGIALTAIGAYYGIQSGVAIGRSFDGKRRDGQWEIGLGNLAGFSIGLIGGGCVGFALSTKITDFVFDNLF